MFTVNTQIVGVNIMDMQRQSLCCHKNLPNQKLPLDQTGWPQLTTQGRGSPLYGDALGGTLVSEGSNSGTETLTVSSRVTGTGIKHTSVTETNVKITNGTHILNVTIQM